MNFTLILSALLVYIMFITIITDAVSASHQVMEIN